MSGAGKDSGPDDGGCGCCSCRCPGCVVVVVWGSAVVDMCCPASSSCPPPPAAPGASPPISAVACVFRPGSCALCAKVSPFRAATSSDEGRGVNSGGGADDVPPGTAAAPPTPPPACGCWRWTAHMAGDRSSSGSRVALCIVPSVVWEFAPQAWAARAGLVMSMQDREGKIRMRDTNYILPVATVVLAGTAESGWSRPFRLHHS